MADKKISQLTGATTPLAGTEVLPIVQSNTTVKVSVADLTAGRSVSATNISAGLGAVGTPAYTFAGDLNTGMWSPTADTVAFSQGGTERMRITATGDVGIGTPAPGVKLDVAGDSTGFYAGGAIAIRDANTPGNSVLLGQASHIFGGGGSTNAALINNGAGYFAFGTAGTERMRIDASGNLLVGGTTAVYAVGERLSVANSGGNNGIGVAVGGSGAKGIGIYNGNSSGATSGTMIEFQNSSSGVVGSITADGTNTAYNTSSDARLKHDIADAPDAADLIDAIKVRSFKWNADNSAQRYGFVAQELLEVAPEAVSQLGGSDPMLGVDYSKLVPMLVKELQSVRARLAQLEGN